MWFIPPYSRSVKADVCRYFLRQLQKQFPPNQNFGVIFPVKGNIYQTISCTSLRSLQVTEMISIEPTKKNLQDYIQTAI